jgi:hypothetical protein
MKYTQWAEFVPGEAGGPLAHIRKISASREKHVAQLAENESAALIEEAVALVRKSLLSG